MPNRRELGYVSSGASGSVPANTYGAATGGSSSSITVSGQNYTLLTFTSDATLTVTKSGLFDVLLVGGGAGSGGDSGGLATGGGGGGGVSSTSSVTTIYLDANQSIDIGAVASQWLRFVITLITMFLNVVSKMLYPTNNTNSTI